CVFLFFFSSRRRHTRCYRDWSSDVCSSDLYSERIPNNVDLANDRTLQRALEHWQPRFLDWWKELGPNDFANADVYLRTAVGVDRSEERRVGKECGWRRGAQ